MQFRTRKEQIEKSILKRCMKTPTRAVLKEELGVAAMVGACEERERILTMLIHSTLTPEASSVLIDRICEASVMEVLGYK